MNKNFYALLMVLIGISAPCSPAAPKKSPFARLFSRKQGNNIRHIHEECAVLPERPQPASVPPAQLKGNAGRMERDAQGVVYIPSKKI